MKAIVFLELSRPPARGSSLFKGLGAGSYPKAPVRGATLLLLITHPHIELVVKNSLWVLDSDKIPIAAFCPQANYGSSRCWRCVLPDAGNLLEELSCSLAFLLPLPSAYVSGAGWRVQRVRHAGRNSAVNHCTFSDTTHPILSGVVG